MHTQNNRLASFSSLLEAHLSLFHLCSLYTQNKPLCKGFPCSYFSSGVWAYPVLILESSKEDLKSKPFLRVKCKKKNLCKWWEDCSMHRDNSLAGLCLTITPQKGKQLKKPSWISLPIIKTWVLPIRQSINSTHWKQRRKRSLPRSYSHCHEVTNAWDP